MRYKDVGSQGLVCIITFGDIRNEYLKVVLKEVRKLNEKSIKFDTKRF